MKITTEEIRSLRATEGSEAISSSGLLRHFVPRNDIFVLLMLLIFCFSADISFAAQEKAAAKKAESQIQKTEERKEPTREDLIERLKATLEHEDEIMGFIPGLKKEKDVKGNIIYTYQSIKIEDLDEK